MHGSDQNLDRYARLAAQVTAASAALILLDREGGLAPAAVHGLAAEAILPAIELCRRLRTGPETTVAFPHVPSPDPLAIGEPRPDAAAQGAQAPGSATSPTPGPETAAPAGQGPRMPALDQGFVSVGLVTPAGDVIGRLCVLRWATEGDLPAEGRHALELLGGLIAGHIGRELQHAQFWAASQRATRTERMLHQVAEAGSVTDALTNMLSELCSHHGAVIGRIWRLTPDDLMQEVSRYNDDVLDESSYYRRPPSAPVMWGNSFTADAIRRNQPRSIVYSQIEHPERYALLGAAMETGLKCQVSVPVWVQEDRFGVALSFNTERDDLADVLADVAALANTIRPALFRKVTEDRIRFLAHHDDLTQLPNRLLFQQRMSEAVAAARDGGAGLALLYLDLNSFKQVNDTRGHAVGDRLLAAVAQRLRENVRGGDTVARMGGDEFAVIQPHTSQPAAAIRLAGRIVGAMTDPFDVDGQRLVIGCSVGIAVYPGHGATPDLLLRNADTALYRAKETGRNGYCLFEAGMNARERERVLIEGDMAEALARRQFTLAFQPLCDAATLEVVGFEALLRWDHPSRGSMSPSYFVALAEASGLIVPLGQWALEAACIEAARWQPHVRVAVNLSPMQFRQPDLPQRVAEALARSGLDPRRLDLEVTEGLLLDNAGLVLDTMNALRAQGIGMTLDDFGTAYASLSYLRRFPFDRIKIDKSFVDSIAEDGETLAIVQTILALSVRLKLSVVAEGVERPAQLETLRGLGCKLVQGYLTGRPLTAAEVMLRLAAPAA